ncbi:MAG: UDP-glucose/GDP-mannose dehydrogenase family protein [Bacteroidales bacterium]|jgi:UDPglucose 6-dehydrogenase|nr:UDP-glucose/GDP-mannose dehydrogenase family protein [Bacteroidales bacterium]
MNITIVGSGYVGLVTGTCFAEAGVNVVCVDVDKTKIENLQKGISPIYEPGLDELITKNINNGRLKFSTNLVECIDNSEVIFSAVGTPPDEDGSADLQYVLDVARTIGKNMKKYACIVTKSTVPVHTAKKVRAVIEDELAKRGEKIEFDVCSNPEFLKEGNAVRDFLFPDRVVIGVDSDRAQEVMSRLYRPFTLNNHSVIFMDVPSAEMTKYAANAMLAVRISFMNEIANLCDEVGADVNAVRKGIGSDKRIGNKFLYSGIGYGGSCFPKDVKALYHTGLNYDCPMKIIRAAEDVNDEQKLVIYHKLKAKLGDLKSKTICLWGLSFKPETDDMREAPSLYVISALAKEQGCIIKAYDPIAMSETKRRLPDIDVKYCNNMYEAAQGADAILLLTEWKEFRLPDWDKIKSEAKGNIVLDGRNIYEAKYLRELGFDYSGIGTR